MRVWITSSLLAFAFGCSGREASVPLKRSPAKANSYDKQE